MGSKLYQRHCTVQVADLLVENKHGIGLRIAFEVKQSIDSKSNTADVTIYNLNANSRGRVLKESPLFTIKAGYVFSGSSVAGFIPEIPPAGLIFSGKASSAMNKRGEVGWETSISAEDGKEEKRAIVNQSLAPGATIAQLIQSIAGNMKVNVTKAVAKARKGDFDGALKQYSNGFTLSGTAQIELDKLCASIGADWSIQNGELQILTPDQTSDNAVVLLSSETGLINSPTTQWKKIETKGGEKSTSKKLVMKAQSLLQPGLTPGRRVRIKSQSINGDFRIINSQHSGDTDSDNWLSEIEAVSISPPAIVTDITPIGVIA